MNFEHSDKVKALLAEVSGFMDEHVYPQEEAYYDWSAIRPAFGRNGRGWKR